MKSIKTVGHAIFLIFILCLSATCRGQEDLDIAPMEKAEQEALYSTIQGFVGNSWNGSDLYPDPCGWTPIQVPLTRHLALPSSAVLQYKLSKQLLYTVLEISFG